MTPETAMWIGGAVVVPVMIWLLTAIRRTLANFGARLGQLETDVAVLLDRSRRVRRVTVTAPAAATEDDEDET